MLAGSASTYYSRLRCPACGGWACHSTSNGWRINPHDAGSPAFQEQLHAMLVAHHCPPGTPTLALTPSHWLALINDSDSHMGWRSVAGHPDTGDYVALPVFSTCHIADAAFPKASPSPAPAASAPAPLAPP